MVRTTSTKGGKNRDKDALAKAQQAVSAVHPCLRLTVSKRARRIALRLDPAARVVHLIVPHRASMERALDFAHQNKLWVEKRLEDLPEPVPFVDGAVLPILGHNVTLHIHYDPKLKMTDIELKPRTLIVKTNKDDAAPRIKRFLRQLANDTITEIAHEKAKKIDRHTKIQSITVRDTRSRWGSCSEDGKMSFSWRLIFAPPLALDYVIAHEVAHLKVMDHSQRFWTQCEKLSDDFDFGYDWMQKNGHSLMRYGQDG